MSKPTITCEEQLKKAKRLNWVLGFTAPLLFLFGMLIKPLFFHHDLNLVGGGHMITQDEANTMVIDYHNWNEHWLGRWEHTNSFLIKKDILDLMSTNPLVTHYHVFYGRHNGNRTLVFAGAKNVSPPGSAPVFENVPYLDPAQGNQPYFMEHVFPIDREICHEISPTGARTANTWLVRQYPDNQPH